MKNTVKLELKKAIRNKFFLIAVIIGCVVTTFSALYNMEQNYSETENIRRMESQSATVFNQDPASFNLFNRWVGGEAYSFGSSAFFLSFRFWSPYRTAGPIARKKRAAMCVTW